jgi:hypothetical protein
MTQVAGTDPVADVKVGERLSKDGEVSRLPSAAWFIPVALAVLMPGLLTQALRLIHSTSIRLLVMATAVVVAIAVAVVLALYFLVFGRNLRRSLAVAAALIFVSFAWLFWTILGAFIAEPFGVSAIRDVATVVIPIGIVWAAARYGERDVFVVIASGIGVALIVLMGAMIVPKLVSTSPPPTATGAASSGPNTLLLILDGYARADVLARDYGYEGPHLVDELAARGFAVRNDALTNYSITYASVSSMMAMDYPFDDGFRSDAELASMRDLLSGVSPLVGAYQAAGYTVTKNENGWAGSQCSSWIDNCVRPNLVRTAFWSVFQLTPFAPIQRAVSGHPFTTIGLEQIRALPEMLIDDADPQFIFAHVTVPHAPAQLDASCTLNPRGAGSGLHLADPGDIGEQIADARARYVGQVQCIDREVLASIDALLERDPSLAVLVIADHGPDSRGQLMMDPGEWSNEAVFERMAVLSAMRLPSDCSEAGPARTTVNTVRRLVSCTLGLDLEPLPERHFFAPRENVKDLPISEITERLGSISALASR